MRKSWQLFVTKSFPWKKINQDVSLRLSKISLTIAAASIFSGCATAPPKEFSKLESGVFQAKVLMRDKKESRSGIVNLQVKAIQDQKLRMDILSPIQTHIASVALKGDELAYLIVAEKRGYRGMSSPNAMLPVLKIPLDPKILYNIFFDKPIADKNWTCTQDEKGMPKDCKQLRGGMKIKWTSREGIKRILEIDHPKAFLQINIHGFEGSVKADDPKFDLKIPDSFKLI